MLWRVSVLVLGLMVLSGCVSGSDPLEDRDTMRIEVLGFGGCPNTPTMRDRVVEAVGVLGSGYVLVEVDQESLAADDLRRGYPTPTVLVDGVDLFGLPTPSSPAMGCRVYPGGVPSAEEIGARLAEFGAEFGAEH